MEIVLGNILKDEYNAIQIIVNHTKTRFSRITNVHLDFGIYFNFEGIAVDNKQLYLRIYKNHLKEMTYFPVYKEVKEIVLDGEVEYQEELLETTFSEVEELLIVKKQLKDVSHLSFNFIPELMIFNIIPIYLDEVTKELKPKKEDYDRYLKEILTNFQVMPTEQFKEYFKNKVTANYPNKLTIAKELAKKNIPIFVEKEDSYQTYRKQSLDNLKKSLLNLENKKSVLKTNFFNIPFIQDNLFTDVINKSLAGDIDLIITKPNVSIMTQEFPPSVKWNWVFIPAILHKILYTIDNKNTIYNILKGE